jgi:hypothetical protein
MKQRERSKNKKNLELLRIYLAKQNENKPKSSVKFTARDCR